jgi:hypothetical protein
VTETAVPIGTPAVVVDPGRPVKFAVIARDGSRSGTWVVWASRRRLDVYLTALMMARSWKVSLHQTGSWSHGFLSDQVAKTLGHPGPLRHLDIWPRPADFAPGMWRGFSVWVPHDELRPCAMHTPDEGVVTVPDPGPGFAAAIEFVYMAGDQPLRLDFAEPVFLIALLRRVDGSVMTVTARQVPWTATEQQWLGAAKAACVDAIVAAGGEARLRAAGCAGIVLMGVDLDGTRRALEAAIDMPSAFDSTVSPGDAG